MTEGFRAMYEMNLKLLVEGGGRSEDEDDDDNGNGGGGEEGRDLRFMDWWVGSGSVLQRKVL